VESYPLLSLASNDSYPLYYVKIVKEKNPEDTNQTFNGKSKYATKNLLENPRRTCTYWDSISQASDLHPLGAFFQLNLSDPKHPKTASC
jgi:hypothetical protein